MSWPANSMTPKITRENGHDVETTCVILGVTCQPLCPTKTFKVSGVKDVCLVSCVFGFLCVFQCGDCVFSWVSPDNHIGLDALISYRVEYVCLSVCVPHEPVTS